MTTRYFAHISAAGPIRYGRIPGAIGVLDAPDHPMPIGMAFEARSTLLAAAAPTGFPRRASERWLSVMRSELIPSATLI